MVDPKTLLIPEAQKDIIYVLKTNFDQPTQKENFTLTT